MYNLYARIAGNAGSCRQFSCDEALVTIFNCKLQNKLQGLWSHHNYILYVLEGRKVWHTSNGSYDLRKGSCVFIRKGASIVEQFFDTEFCFFLFFLPDEFIYDVLKNKSTPIQGLPGGLEPVITIHNNASVEAFFQSMMPYFEASREPDQFLLKLKFSELILTIADDPGNEDMRSYFCTLLREPQHISLKKTMEENFCFNLRLEEFAKLSSRSLSAFKRDFVRIFNDSPGRWLMEKRLNHSLHLLTNMGKTVSEAAFESGFESSSHFSRAFRQRFGMSPQGARQQAYA